MTIEKVKIEEIKKNPNNPRIIKDENFKKLVKSIQEFPQMLEIRPIVVDDNMIVLGGNMRLKACKEAGLKEIPIIKASDLTDEQKSEFIIKDNVGYGLWDFDMLNSDWDTDLLSDWALDMPTIKENKSSIESINSMDEWIGMPEFIPSDEAIKMIITFENEDKRKEFTEIYNINPSSKSSKTWSASWPDKGRKDISSLRYE